MHNVYDFIKWALSHVDPNTKIKSATYPLPSGDVGADPWHYLFGTFGQQTSAWLIEYCWERHYKTRMTRAKYDAYTADWKPTDRATDCQGLLDAYLTYVIGVYTDINADTNYNDWCEDEGEIDQISRPYVIGEAVFMFSESTGKMHHVGWVCGFMPDGEPLIVEARSISCGVVITKLNSRNWTHRGLMTKMFDYAEPSEPIKLELASPMMQGDYVLYMQQALNALHYPDANGRALEEDGICGRRTIEAVTSFANAHAAIEPETKTVMPPFVEQIMLEQYGLIVGVINAEDITRE